MLPAHTVQPQRPAPCPYRDGFQRNYPPHAAISVGQGGKLVQPMHQRDSKVLSKPCFAAEAMLFLDAGVRVDSCSVCGDRFRIVCHHTIEQAETVSFSKKHPESCKIL